MIDGRPEIIVTLTSFPEAVPYAAKAIQSVLDGSLMPDRIVLYLDSWRFPDGTIPPELERIKAENRIFEIRFDPADIRSYKKLVPALRDFPDDILVTIDDDIRYHRNMLRDLVRMHKKLPDAIIAHRVRKVQLEAPYGKWKKYKWYDFILKRIHFSRLAMQTGVGGVLYPPHSLDKKMLAPSVFMELAPTNDDVWFWAAAVSQGTYVVPLPGGHSTAKEIGKPAKYSLKTINLVPENDRNRSALENILDRYPEIRNKIKNDR